MHTVYSSKLAHVIWTALKGCWTPTPPLPVHHDDPSKPACFPFKDGGLVGLLLLPSTEHILFYGPSKLARILFSFRKGHRAPSIPSPV